MPVEGLPLVLEDALMNMMDTGYVSSWNIKGGNEYGQVTIRFKMAPSSAKQTDVKYRKEPPSRTRRNMKRAAIYKDNNHMNSVAQPVDSKPIEDNFTYSDIADDTTVNLNTAGILLSPMHGSLSPVVQVDGPLDGACGSQPCGSQPSEASTGRGVINDLEQKATSMGSGATNICHNKFLCSNCGIDIDQGRRCLLCANIFICDSCYDEGFHKKCFIGSFDITKVPSDVHCLGCFKPLGDKKSIFKCASCKNYYQCPTCQVNCLHYYHRDHLEEMPLEDVT